MRLTIAAAATCALASVAIAQGVRQRRSALPDWALDATAHIVPQLAVINGVRLGGSERSVRRALGRPDSLVREFSEVLDSTRTLYYRLGRIVLSPRGVEYFDCWGSSCRLASGVGVGSTLQQVVRSLGRGHPGYGDANARVLIYYIRGCDCWLYFEFDASSHVRQVSLETDNS